MAKYVAAIDQGTTSTRCILFDHDGNAVASDQREHEQIFPRPGWVEHDPLEIWERTETVVRNALEKGRVERKDVAAIGVTNQRERSGTGKSVQASINARRQDTYGSHPRPLRAADRLRQDRPLVTYFSPKLKWLLTKRRLAVRVSCSSEYRFVDHLEAPGTVPMSPTPRTSS
jgi:glycerol kinase